MEYAKDNNLDERLMVESGFEVDTINNLYNMPGFGVYMGNVDKKIRNISDLLESNESSKYKKYINKGYKLVIGPGAPDADGITREFGVYCYNYPEVIEAKNEKVKRLLKFLG